MKLTYRPDIDGLRAVAVLSVLFFHTSIPGFGGGFVGVDIFFVISGYLITSILLKDLEEGNFSIARFYERRIRRIFPALFPVIAFSLIAGFFVFEPEAFNDLGKSITATTLFTSNIRFFKETGYFAAPSLQKPLLHTWSLAVEEQFYIVFPLLLAALAKFFKKRYALPVAALAILSFAANIYGINHWPDATFFLVHFRAWELLAGSVLALGVIPEAKTPWVKDILSFSGIALIAYSVTCYTESTLFPGYNAIAPVLGATLIIFSGLGGKPALANRIISMKPFVFVGLISYSLYLWHWPLVAFAQYMMFRQFNAIDGFVVVACSFALAIASWKFIEQPFRGNAPLLPARRQLFSAAAIIMAVSSLTGIVIDKRNGFENRADLLYPAAEAAVDIARKEVVLKEYKVWEKNDKLPPIAGNKNAQPVFALWGDSHARAFIPAVAFEANRFNTSGYIMARSALPALLGMERADKPDNNLAQWHKEVLSFIDLHPEIKTVILAGRWAWYAEGASYKQDNDGNAILKDVTGTYQGKTDSHSLFNTGLSRTVNALIRMRRKVIIVNMVPEIGFDVTRYLILKSRFPSFYGDTGPTIDEYQARYRYASSVLKSLDSLPGVSIIHPEALLFDNSGRVMITHGDKLLYRDSNHLSEYGALYVSSAFDQAFESITKEK